MALLDFLNSDDARLGLSLLAAAGPTAQPMSTGQRLSGALLNFDATRAANEDRRFKRQLMQSQIEENRSQNLYRAGQLGQMQRKNDVLAGVFGDAGGAATGGGAPAASGATGGAPALLGNPTSRISSLTPDQLALLKASAGVDLTDIYKLTQPNWQNVNGNLVNTNAPGFRGGIQDGVFAGPDGRVTLVRGNNGNPVTGAVPGSFDTYEQFEDIKGRAGARYSPGRPVLRDGRPYGQSQLDEIRGASGPGYAGGSAAAAAGGQREIITSELGKAQKELAAARALGDGAGVARAQADIAGLQRELARLPGGAPSSSADGALDFSPQEKAAQEANRAREVKTAEADVVRDTDTQKKAKGARAMIAAADRAIELLQQGPTASGMGEMIDRGAAFVGKSTPGAQIAAQLDVVSGDLVNNVPRMEGPQSDGDRLEYKTQAGQAANRTLPVPQRLAAMQEVKRLQMKYAHLNGGLEDQALSQAPRASGGGSFQSFGYASAGDAVRDAQSAIMRGANRDAVQKRLQQMGLSLPDRRSGDW